MLAVCDCGKKVTAPARDIRSGNSRSCGCLRSDANPNRKHGKSKTRMYGTWLCMKARCLDPFNSVYHRYGGRGVRVVDRWLDFENFLADMGERPPGMTLDRIDNNGDYGPENCRWATPAEQSRNRRSNIYATLNGETKCLLDWCKEMGLKYDRTRWLVKVKGLAPEEALFTPAWA